MNKKAVATSCYLLALIILGARFITVADTKDFMIVMGILLVGGGLLLEHVNLEKKGKKKSR